MKITWLQNVVKVKPALVSSNLLLMGSKVLSGSGTRVLLREYGFQRVDELKLFEHGAEPEYGQYE